MKAAEVLIFADSEILDFQQISSEMISAQDNVPVTFIEVRPRNGQAVKDGFCAVTIPRGGCKK